MGLGIAFDAIGAALAEFAGGFGAEALGAGALGGLADFTGAIAPEALLAAGATDLGVTGSTLLGAGLGAAGAGAGAAEAFGGGGGAAGVGAGVTPEALLAAPATDLGVTGSTLLGAGPALAGAGGAGLDAGIGGGGAAALDAGGLTGLTPTGFDVGGAIPAAGATPTTTLPPATTIAPGVQSTASSVAGDIPSFAPTAGVGPGPGAASFAPPPQAIGGALDPTSALASGQGGSLFSGVTDTSAALGGPTTTDLGVTQGTLLGPTSGDAAGSAFGGATSDAASPATYGATSTFDTGNTVGAGAGISGDTTSGTGLGGLLDKAGTFLNSPTGKLIGTGVAGAGLLRNLMTSSSIPQINISGLTAPKGDISTLPGASQLTQLASSLGGNIDNAGSVAAQATGQAGVLQNYLTTGTLPPALQASLDQATTDGITAIKAQYAARGMPPGSSSEVADINHLKQNAVIQGGTLAASLFSQGVTLDQIASSIYQNLIGAGSGAASGLASASAGQQNLALGAGSLELGQNAQTIAQNTQLNQSIASLAAALGGGRGNVILNTGTQAV